MGALGVLLLVVGAAGVVAAFAIDSSVSGSTVANLDKMSQREMLTVASSAAFVAGSVFAAAAGILARLDRAARQGAASAEAGEMARAGTSSRDEPTAAEGEEEVACDDGRTGIFKTPDGRYRVGDRTYRSVQSAKDYQDLVSRIGGGR